MVLLILRGRESKPVTVDADMETVLSHLQRPGFVAFSTVVFHDGRTTVSHTEHTHHIVEVRPSPKL